jgi:hypothetical protein
MDTKEQIKEMIKMLGIEDLSEPEQKDILLKLSEKAIILTIMQTIKEVPGDKNEEFDAVADSKDEEAIRNFLEKNVPDFQKIFDNNVRGVIEEYKKTKLI